MASTETTMTKTTTTTQEPLLNNAPYKPYVCPEEEVPLSIGPYEVPTQKDLVVHMKKILMKMFKSYHKKALFFLNDVMKATRATSQIERSCPIKSRNTYKLCVRHVSNQCQVITKSFVTSLERQRHDVSAFTEASICNMSSMKADPVQLIKTIAMEDASLEFALPGFLRLLGACSVYCQRTPITAHWKKPKRHMTDQDLVIKHFLTRKNYAQLLKEHLT
ncbi:uncharacterized protein LOC114354302 [Ostrinia furnacalis]|nr:uncharacterized protein LOC114354302 [Ostrinia furnacalis]